MTWKNSVATMDFSKMMNTFKSFGRLLKVGLMKWNHNFCFLSLVIYILTFSGSFKAPHGGFTNFRLKIYKKEDETSLPVGHTCFLMIEL